MDVVLPDSPQAWGFATLVFTSVTAAIGWIANRWANQKIARDTAVLTAQAKVQEALAVAQERLITAAEKRETVADARADKALALNDKLTTITTEQMATIKLILDEVRRGNGNYEALVRELNFRPRS